MKICVLRCDGEKVVSCSMLHSVEAVVKKIYGKRNIRVEKEREQFAEEITFDVYPFEQDVEVDIMLFVQAISRLHPAYAVRILSC